MKKGKMETKEQKVPTNDAEAKHMLSEGRDDFVSRNLIGIYRCRRATGATVLEAFEAALNAHIDAYRRARQACSEPIDRTAEQTWWAGYEYVDTK